MLKQKGKGKFLVIDGIDGSGKSLQVKILQERLITQYGIASLATREPGGSPLAEKIRALLLQRTEYSMDAVTEALLFNAARRNHLLSVITPALEKGLWVLCDRFSLSGLAYQSAGGACTETLEILHSIAVSNTKDLYNNESQHPCIPDLGLLLDLPYEQALQRISINKQGIVKSTDAFECRDSNFFARVRANFLEHARSKQFLWSIIDARKSVGQVAEIIEKKVVRHFLLNPLTARHYDKNQSTTISGN